MRLPSVSQPVIPKPILGAFGQMRRDLRFLAFLHPFALRGFGREVRPYPRHERDAFTVAKPLERQRPGRNGGEARRFATVGRD